METVSIDNMTENIIESEGLIQDFDYPCDFKKQEIDDFINKEIIHNSEQKLSKAIRKLFNIAQKNPKKLYIVIARILNHEPKAIKKLYNSQIKNISSLMNDKYIHTTITNVKKTNPELAKILQYNKKRRYE